MSIHEVRPATPEEAEAIAWSNRVSGPRGLKRIEVIERVVEIIGEGGTAMVTCDRFDLLFNESERIRSYVAKHYPDMSIQTHWGGSSDIIAVRLRPQDSDNAVVVEV